MKHIKEYSKFRINELNNPETAAKRTEDINLKSKTLREEAIKRDKLKNIKGWEDYATETGY